MFPPAGTQPMIYMLYRYMEQQAAVMAVLMDKNIRKNLNDISTLSEQDINQIEQVLQILEPLKTVTTLLCDAKVPTVSLILPLKHRIVESLQERLDQAENINLVASLKGVITNIKSDLMKRYTNPDVQLYLWQSAALDPRFRSLPMLSEEKRLEIYTSLIVKCQQKQASEAEYVRIKVEPGTEPVAATITTPVPEEPLLPQLPEPSTSTAATVTVRLSDSPPKKKTAMESLFGDVFVTHVETSGATKLVQIETEVVRYKTEPCIPISSNPLDWWRENQYTYPNLSHLAKLHLAVPGTSVPSERVFSTAGDIVTAQRSQLTPESVDMLVFLKKNMKI